MKLWLLDRREECDWDEVACFVIRAETEEQARMMANEESSDEGKIWAEPDKVKCSELLPEGDAGIVVRDFKPG